MYLKESLSPTHTEKKKKRVNSLTKWKKHTSQNFDFAFFWSFCSLLSGGFDPPVRSRRCIKDKKHYVWVGTEEPCSYSFEKKI